ncbi:T9SS type A sorting domain-containing protein [Adhaeribacter radiodurans]|uniref:T9SS type A sorting domain-containing protein n=1 Tax=Adhaeribacter radiodurans TaxID=2745197 RepID=A0A7L7LDR5_9BACT|nr:T9SS type A sorting domain-containing protein [Adhaeribacter radiodurans]QMU30549.1 T9SS type A sorting domain-containing protein [Adhaeribacter radiodurans]
MKIQLSGLYRSQFELVLSPGWRIISVLLLFLFSFTTGTLAQSKVWDNTLGGDGTDDLVLVQQTSDGGYILGGSSTSGKAGDKTEPNRDPGTDNNSYYTGDYWIVKLKADGSKAWDKTFGGNSRDELRSLQQTSDGGYILGGTSYSGISGDKSEANKGKQDEFGNITNDYWIVKIDASGNKQWDKTFGGDNYDYLVSVQQTKEGDYILGGHSESGANVDKTEPSKGGWDWWVVKMDASGRKIWDKSFGENQYDNLVNLVLTSDNGYLLAGSFYGDTRIIKLKADGTPLWEKVLDVRDLTSLQATPDGGYVAGYTATTSTYSHDYGIIKLKADGTQVWNKTYGGNKEDWLTTAQPTQDGGYILGGGSSSGISDDKTEPVKGPCNDDECDTDFWLIKLRADGTKEWDKTIGGIDYDFFASVQQTSDGGYILGGTSNSGISGDKSEARSGYWVEKLDNKIRLNQSITFAPILLNKAVGDPPFTLSAKANSGLSVTFKVVSGPATVSGNKVTLTGEGTVHLQAIQAGNGTYNPALVDRSFIVEEKKLIKKLWDKTFGGFNREVLTAMIATPDGGYLVGGYSVSGKSADKSNTSRGNKDYWLVKLNAQGVKVWDKTYGGSKSDSLTAIISTPDGGYLLGGASASGVSGDKSQANKGNYDYWLIKIDATGTKIWDKVYGGREADNLITLLATPDGGYLLGGTSTSGISGDKSQISKGSTDYWLLKINATGTKLWDRTYGGSEAENLTALTAATEGGYLVGGSSASGKSGDKSQASRGFEDYWIVRLKEDGTKLWDKTYGGFKQTYEYEDCPYEDPKDCEYQAGSSILTALFATPDGGYLVGGYSNADKNSDKTNDNDGQLRDYWLLKIDAKGSKLWDKTYGGVRTEISTGPGGWYYTGNSLLRTIIAAPDGDYILAGTSDSYKGRDKSENTRVGERYTYPAGGGGYYLFFPGEEDYWVLKITGEGTKKWDRTIGSRNYDELQAIVATPDGSYVLAGTTYNAGIGGDKTEATRDTTGILSNDKGDYWVVKIKDEMPPVTSAWNMRYGGSGTEGFTAVIKTSDGGYLSGGYTNSGISGDKTQPSQGLNDYWIVKSDKNGKKLWDKRYGGSGEDYLNTLIQTSDGGYLLGGSSESGSSGDKSQTSRGGRDCWIIKINSNGTKVWDKRFGGTGSDEIKKVIQLSTGEYLLAGMSNSPVSGDKSQSSRGGQDYWLVKIKGDGTKIWDKRFGGSLNENLEGLALTINGDYLLGGSSFSGISGDKTQASRGGADYWLVRVSSSGNKVWDKRFGGTGEDNLMDVGSTGTSTGNLFIAGHSTSGAEGDRSQNSQGGKDFWMLKLNSSGEKLWDKRFGGSGHEGLRTILLTQEGGYLLAGRSESGVSGDKTQSNQGSSDYWIVKTSSTGIKQWDKRFGGSNYDEIRMALQTADGGFLLGGRSESGVSGDRTQPSQGSSDYWLVKVAPETSSILAERETALAEEPKVKAELSPLQAYPNPVKDKVTASFTLPQTQPVSLKVYDSQGQEVTTLFQGEAQANKAYEVIWQPKTSQPNGMYILRLQTTRSAQTQRILFTK